MIIERIHIDRFGALEGVDVDGLGPGVEVLVVEADASRRELVTDSNGNSESEDVVYLEVGDRSPGDEASYPDDDLKAVLIDRQWEFTHKDGTPYV